MPRPTDAANAPPAAVQEALTRLGQNLRTARLRRRLRLSDLAERVGVTRFTLANVERGKPSTAIAAYAGALWALGLLDQLEAVADPAGDAEGLALERARQPQLARPPRALDDDF
jgi:transcriptional regulator with XRE-family HTH domain